MPQQKLNYDGRFKNDSNCTYKTVFDPIKVNIVAKWLSRSKDNWIILIDLCLGIFTHTVCLVPTYNNEFILTALLESVIKSYLVRGQ